jgi:DNA replication protein DnaC
MSMTMTEIDKSLRALRLSGIRATLETRALQANQGEMSFIDAFAMLLQDEMDRRRTGLMTRRLKESSLPELKTLQDFDWSFNPKLPKKDCFELVAAKFINEHDDALLIGAPGTGKSHIAKATGHSALRAGYSVVYRDAHALFNEIVEATQTGTRKKIMRVLSEAELLIIDDLFLRKLPRDAGDDLLEIIMNRYEKRSTVITRNQTQNI